MFDSKIWFPPYYNLHKIIKLMPQYELWKISINNVKQIILTSNKILQLMGNKFCLSKFRKQKKIPPDVLPSSSITNDVIPHFMNPFIYTFLSAKKNIFEGIQSSHNGIQIIGHPNPSWLPAGQSLMYKGQWKQEKKHGKGLLYILIQESLIIGYFYQDNLLLNKCLKIYSKGIQYLGQLNIVYEMHGVGKVIGKTFTYEGELKNDRFDGKGVLKRENYQFKGKFKGGLKKYGNQKTQQGTYVGPYRDNQRSGQGVFNWKNGGRYEGPFVQNKMHGLGKLFDTEGNYCGQHQFQRGRRIF